MAGKKRLCIPGKIHYIFTRSINERELFTDESDKQRFLTMLKKGLEQTGFECLKYELSKRSYKLVIKINHLPLCNLFRPLNSNYATFYNKRHSRIGHLFHRRFKSVPIDEKYKKSLSEYLSKCELSVNSKEVLREKKGKSRGEIIDLDELIESFPEEQCSGELDSFESKLVNIENETVNRYDPYCWSIGRKQFIEKVLSGFQEKLHLVANYTFSQWTLPKLREFVCNHIPVSVEEFAFRGRLNNQSAARKLFSYLAVRKLEYRVADVARFLKVSGSAVSKLAKKGSNILKELDIIFPSNPTVNKEQVCLAEEF